MFKKLKKRWGVQSNFQLLVIFLVFGITGSMSVKLGQPILDYFAITKDSYGVVLYYLLRIVLIFPLYQILLIGFGTLFFQFKFFWEFEKKMLRKMGLYPKEK
ncbi:MAG: DUF6787 family protein [Flavobacteriaceae bacterium]